MKRTPLKRKTPLRAAPREPGTPKPKPKTSKLKSLRNKADRLAREWCKRLAVCEAQGEDGMSCSDRMEWCHLKSRGYGAIRHDPNNAVCLCNVHHRWYTMHPDRWTFFCERLRPGIWDYLNEQILQHKTGVKEPLVSVYERWINFYQALAPA